MKTVSSTIATVLGIALMLTWIYIIADAFTTAKKRHLTTTIPADQLRRLFVQHAGAGRWRVYDNGYTLIAEGSHHPVYGRQQLRLAVTPNPGGGNLAVLQPTAVYRLMGIPQWHWSLRRRLRDFTDAVRALDPALVVTFY